MSIGDTNHPVGHVIRAAYAMSNVPTTAKLVPPNVCTSETPIILALRFVYANMCAIMAAGGGRRGIRRTGGIARAGTVAGQVAARAKVYVKRR